MLQVYLQKITMKLLAVIGTRPQYIKHSALQNANAANRIVDLVVVDTGQHYDNNLSDIFLEELNIPKPKYNLQVQLDGAINQIGLMIKELELVVKKEIPQAIVVYGDTNSTFAGALVGVKNQIPVVHVEAGMRNGNIFIPEENNRVMTDHICSILFASTETALQNLISEGLGDRSILSGDVIVDVLDHQLANMSTEQSGGRYAFFTMHRPFNTHDKKRLDYVLNCVNGLEVPVFFPIHPRTKNKMNEVGLDRKQYPNITFTEPIGFVDTVQRIHRADFVITDSGSLQKEAYIMKKKCISIMPVTPWKETESGGWNTTVFESLDQLSEIIEQIPDDATHDSDIFGRLGVSTRMLEQIRKQFT